jgi:hypothetical protein
MSKTNMIKMSMIAASFAIMNVYGGTLDIVESEPTSYAVEAGIATDNVFRGADIGAKESQATISSTTTLPSDIVLELGATYGVADASTLEDKSTDLTVAFNKQLADYLVTLKYNWYSQDYTEGDAGQAQEVGLAVSRYFGPVNVSYTQYVAVVGDHGAYSELAAVYSADLGTPLTFDFNAELGYLAEEGKVTHFETRVSTDIPFVAGVSAVPFVAYSFALSDSTDISSDMKNVFFAGVEFKREF